MNIPIRITFHSTEQRNQWLKSEGVNPVAYAACGEPIRFVGERYTLEAPINKLRMVHGEMKLNPA